MQNVRTIANKCHANRTKRKGNVHGKMVASIHNLLYRIFSIVPRRVIPASMHPLTELVPGVWDANLREVIGNYRKIIGSSGMIKGDSNI